jgi:hypothetical protein
MSGLEIAKVALLLAVVAATFFAASFLFVRYLIDHHYVTI